MSNKIQIYRHHQQTMNLSVYIHNYIEPCLEEYVEDKFAPVCFLDRNSFAAGWSYEFKIPLDEFQPPYLLLELEVELNLNNACITIRDNTNVQIADLHIDENDESDTFYFTISNTRDYFKMSVVVVS